MADLTQEQFEQLPDFLKDDYTEVEGVFKHAGFLKVKQTADRLDARLKESEQEKRDAEAAKSAEITKGIEDALALAVEAGDTKAQLRLEREKLDDERKRINEEIEGLNEIRGTMAGEVKKTIIDRLSLKAKDEYIAAVKRMLKDYIEVDSKTRQVTFKNEDGSASSLTEATFYTEFLCKSEVFKSLLKADLPTHGGGQSNGSLDGSASLKKPQEMNSKERAEFATRDPAGFKKAFKL